jgi:branched-chain amino acid transport system ATP-binding protein
MKDTNMTRLLEIKDLVVNYGKAKALDGISLHVDSGEIVSIVGANGMGKTTIIRTISGLKKPTSGEIWFQNQRIDRLAPHRIVKIGIIQVPAGRMIVSEMTVLDNLRIGAYRRKDREGVNRDLEVVFDHFPMLKEKQGQKGSQLSGGQQQMLAVGRALMAKPKLLLMDEPSIGLSPILVAEVGKIIRDINKGGVSILLVEQNCRMALNLAKRAYIIELGVNSLEGESDKLANDERVQKFYLGSS